MAISLVETLLYHLPENVLAYFISLVSTQRPPQQGPDPFELYEEQLSIFIEATNIGLNSRKIKNINSFPNWLNIDLLEKGQAFCLKYYFSICYSNMISLYLLFAHDRSLRPLIYTNRSSDFDSAYKRYLSTINRVRSWYEYDLTDYGSVARRNIQKVNNFHLDVSSKLNAMDEDEFVSKSEINPNLIYNNNNYCSEINKVLKSNNVKYNNEFFAVLDSCIHLNQTHMAVTQFGFMGLILLYPEKFGIYPDEDELISFIHLWKYIGYLLGIEDKYNLCSGDLDSVRIKNQCVLDCILKPCLSHVGMYWQHMSICAFSGINKIFKNLLFETTLAYLLYSINLDFNDYYDTMQFKSKFKYYVTRFIFKFLIPRENIRNHLNKFVIKLLDKEQNK